MIAKSSKFASKLTKLHGNLRTSQSTGSSENIWKPGINKREDLSVSSRTQARLFVYNSRSARILQSAGLQAFLLQL